MRHGLLLRSNPSKNPYRDASCEACFILDPGPLLPWTVQRLAKIIGRRHREVAFAMTIRRYKDKAVGRCARHKCFTSELESWNGMIYAPQ